MNNPVVAELHRARQERAVRMRLNERSPEDRVARAEARVDGLIADLEARMAELAALEQRRAEAEAERAKEAERRIEAEAMLARLSERVEAAVHRFEAMTEGRGGVSVRVATVAEVVSAYFNIPLSEMVSARRSKVVSDARQIAMYIARTSTTRSLPEIGRYFGRRDHTTVLHAVNKIGDLVGKDTGLAADVAKLRAMIEVRQDEVLGALRAGPAEVKA